MITKKPKIALLRPPSFEVDGSRGHSMDIPLGLLSIASVLQRRGYEVCIFDCRVEGRAYGYRRAYNGGYLLGADWEETTAFMKQASADIVGISCQFTTQSEVALKLARVVKRAAPKIITVMGGPHASTEPEQLLERCRDVDVIVMGEGEYCLAEIAEAWERKRPLAEVKGIVFRDADRIVNTGRRNPIKELDELPLPAYDLIDLEKYFAIKRESTRGDISRPRFDYPGSERSLSLVTSRGCPFNCVFCSIHLHMGKAFRAHSASYVLDHLQQLVDT